MASIVSIEPGYYRIPLPIVLSDSINALPPTARPRTSTTSTPRAARPLMRWAC